MTDIGARTQPQSAEEPKFERWIITEGLSQTRKNFGVVLFAALLHFVISSFSELLPIDGPAIQQYHNGSVARFLVLEILLSIIGVISVVPVLMATHVSLIMGVSNWAAITSRPLKEWDRFVGAIVFWVVGTSLIFALPVVFLPELTLFAAKNRSTTFDAQSFDFRKFVAVFTFVAFPIFSILIATWMPATIYDDKVSLRRVVARGRKTFWYVFSRLLVLILFAMIVSTAILGAISPIMQAVLSKVDDPNLVMFTVNNGGTVVITICLIPIFSVICVRAYILGEARLNGLPDQGVTEAKVAAKAE